MCSTSSGMVKTLCWGEGWVISGREFCSRLIVEEADGGIEFN